MLLLFITLVASDVLAAILPTRSEEGIGGAEANETKSVSEDYAKYSYLITTYL